MEEQEVIVRARAGDLEGWLQVCAARVRPMAWSFSRSSGIPAEDLLQEVTIRLALKSDKVLAVDKPMKYAYVLARNTMINHYRKAARRRRIAPMASFDDVAYFV